MEERFEGAGRREYGGRRGRPGGERERSFGPPRAPRPLGDPSVEPAAAKPARELLEQLLAKMGLAKKVQIAKFDPLNPTPAGSN